jgi:outer membrane protein assembly factor BamB
LINTAFPSRLKTIVLVLILVLLVAGCANTRQGTSWPALSTVEIDGTTAIVVAYDRQIDLVNPDLPISRVANDTEDGWLVNGADFDDAQFYTAPLAVEDDGNTALLFATYNSKLLEFDLDSAAPATTVGIALDDGVIGTPVMNDNLIFIPYRSGDLIALDATAYEEVWRLDTADGIWAAPLLVEDTLYVASIDHLLYAVNAETGDVRWTVDLEGAIAATPLYHDGFLYAGSYSHNLYKIDTNGQIVATYSEGKNWIWSTPVIVDDVLYYADLSGTVYALNSSDLTPIWVSTVADSGGSHRGIRPAPLVTDEYVIAASRNGSVYWLNRADGSLVDTSEIEGKPELLSDMLLLEAGTVAGVDYPLVVVGSTNVDRLLVLFRLDTRQQYAVYER